MIELQFCVPQGGSTQRVKRMQELIQTQGEQMQPFYAAANLVLLRLVPDELEWFQVGGQVKQKRSSRVFLRL